MTQCPEQDIARKRDGLLQSNHVLKSPTEKIAVYQKAEYCNSIISSCEPQVYWRAFGILSVI